MVVWRQPTALDVKNATELRIRKLDAGNANTPLDGMRADTAGAQLIAHIDVYNACACFLYSKRARVN